MKNLSEILNSNEPKGDVSKGDVSKYKFVTFQTLAPVEKEERPRLSISQVNTFRRCPRQWMYRYVYGIKQPPAVALTFGSSLHKSLADGFREIIKSKKTSLSYMLDSFCEDWRENGPQADWTNEAKNINEHEKVGVELIRKYKKEVMPKKKPVAVDVEVNYEDNYTGPWIGYIDLQEEKKITDHKTSSKSYSASQGPHRSHQLAFYAMSQGLNSVTFDVLVKTQEAKIQVMSHQFTPGEINFLWQGANNVGLMIRKIQSRIKTEKPDTRSTSQFFPSCDPTNWACNRKNCGYYDMCFNDLDCQGGESNK